MASQARAAFDKNALDIKRLLEIHKRLGGQKRGRRYDLEVLNKSAVVLITAFWEAYCEDLAAEALEHLIRHATAASSLPLSLRKRVAKDLRAAPHDLAPWDLAGDGWRALLRGRLADLTAERNRDLNTPKATKIDRLFDGAIGLGAVSSAWKRPRVSVEDARQKLDKYVTLRGDIAHRGSALKSCTKKQVQDYFDHVKFLVSKTGGRVNTHVTRSTGTPLW